MTTRCVLYTVALLVLRATSTKAFACTRPTYTTGYDTIAEAELDTAVGFAVTAACAPGYAGAAAAAACMGEGPYKLSGCNVALALGGGHTCTMDDGSTKCWGKGGSGQLGYGDQADRGDAANEHVIVPVS